MIPKKMLVFVAFFRKHATYKNKLYKRTNLIECPDKSKHVTRKLKFYKSRPNLPKGK